MKVTQLNGLVIRLAEASGFPIDALRLKENFSRPMEQEPSHETEILDKLSDIGNFAGLNLLKRNLSVREYRLFLEGDFPAHMLLLPGNDCIPMVVSKELEGYRMFGFPGEVETNLFYKQSDDLFEAYDIQDIDGNQQISVLIGIPIEGVFTITGEDKPHPLKRFFQLLLTEKKEIYYILVYAMIAGGLTLTLPIGVQTIINFVMSGAITDTMILLVAAVVLGTLMTGGLQILQMILVENLQQRLFARAAFEFAYRIPRIKNEAFGKYYPPELMNRFFDVVTVQKSFSKLFTEFTAAVLQASFGLLLLAFYHPFFILFDLAVILVLFFIFRILSPRGLKTNMEESNYKYKSVAWIEEMAKSLTTFKTAGHSNLAIEKMDGYTQGYLKARKAHFNILKLQFGSMVVFKTITTGALLALGSLLVVSRDLSIGQFVAAEIVVILIINATEKIILFLEVIYDMLIGVEKVATVTDLPLERSGTLRLKSSKGGMVVETNELRFRYPNSVKPVLANLNLKIEAGEKIVLAGCQEAGKNTLLMVLGASLTTHEGYLAYNGVSVRDLSLTDLRHNIGFLNRQNDVFDGSLEENLVLNQHGISYAEMIDVCEKVGLNIFIKNLDEGFRTRLSAASRTLSTSVQRRIVIARALLHKPSLILMDEDYSEFITRKDFSGTYDFFNPNSNQTVIAVSSDPELMQKADRILWMQNGHILKQGSYAALSQDPDFTMNCVFR